MNKIKIKLPEAVLEIFSVIKEYGSTAYVVGGSVRDSIIGRPVHDWDICTPVPVPELQVTFEERGYKVIPTGIKHGTITVMVNGIGYEITTFRRDGEYSDGRHPDFVEFTSDLYEDLSRRDFTINAMAYNEEEGLIDPFNGLLDIEKRCIRCVGNAEDRFSEDALRILRAVRFASQLGFAPELYTEMNIHGMYKNLANVSIERINSEFCKIVSSDGFCSQMIFYYDVFLYIIPEIKDLQLSHNNPYHIYNVWSHTVHAVRACKSNDLIVKLATFFHDIGKSHCYQDDEYDIRHFKGHSKVSADITDNIMKRLRFDNETREKVVQLVYYHDSTLEVGEKYVKRWLNKIGEEQFKRLLTLRRADISAQNPLYKEERIKKIDQIEKLLEKVLSEEACFFLKDLAVNGNDIMELFDIKSGKAVGHWLDLILDKVINEELKNDKDEIIKWITLKKLILFELVNLQSYRR